MRSLISTDVLRDVCFGGLSIANGSVDMHDISRKKAFDPLTCSPDKSEPKHQKKIFMCASSILLVIKAGII